MVNATSSDEPCFAQQDGATAPRPFSPPGEQTRCSSEPCLAPLDRTPRLKGGVGSRCRPADGKDLSQPPVSAQLVGAFAEAVQARLAETLAEHLPEFDWATEYRVARTPVDVAGIDDDHLIAVELEWRRADPADNTAKLFRHLAGGALDDFEKIAVVQIFTSYYDLASGGVSSKRENAEFVGRTAADQFDHLTYRAVDFDLDPPKRGGEWPDDWESVADETATAIARRI